MYCASHSQANVSMCASFQTIHSKFNVIHVFVIIVIIPLMLMRETVTPKDEEAQLCFFSFTHTVYHEIIVKHGVQAIFLISNN